MILLILLLSEYLLFRGTRTKASEVKLKTLPIFTHKLHCAKFASRGLGTKASVLKVIQLAIYGNPGGMK